MVSAFKIRVSIQTIDTFQKFNQLLVSGNEIRVLSNESNILPSENWYD